MSTSDIHIAIVEDQDAVREGLRLLVDRSPGLRCEHTFSDAESALEQITNSASDVFDVILMDIGLPGISGVDATSRIKAVAPGMQVVMLTVFEDPERIFASLEAGATGFVLKSAPPAELLAAIQDVHTGGSPMSSPIARRVVERFQQRESAGAAGAGLTPRETQILEFVVRGHRFKEIAESLAISHETVRTHVRNIYEKMQVRSRAEASFEYFRRSTKS